MANGVSFDIAVGRWEELKKKGDIRRGGGEIGRGIIMIMHVIRGHIDHWPLHAMP